MEIVFKPKAQSDREIIKKSGSPATKKRLERILTDILEHPYTGFAGPEELKYDLSGKPLGKCDTLTMFVFVEATMRPVISTISTFSIGCSELILRNVG
ncbi:hypothetical protein SAMD00024442_31_7 [Candidatus Symbiothrix dinenymphae]|nr:hypothetical protein SAMD00024442_31_7 [Candidatus Symbiothrix dinenymphae]